MTVPDIVTYVQHLTLRPPRCLAETLQSLDTATKRPHLVVVVVQGRGPLPPLEEPYSFALEVLHDQDGIGDGRARHLAAADFATRTQASWWARSDDDVLVAPGAWDQLIEALERHPQAGCAMSAVENARPMLIAIAGGVLTETPGGFQAGGVTVCDFVGMGCTVAPAPVMRLVQPDPALFMGGVDLDIALQLRSWNRTSLFCDPPRSTHRHRQCSDVEYERLRFDRARIRADGARLEQKWGPRIPTLSAW